MTPKLLCPECGSIDVECSAILVINWDVNARGPTEMSSDTRKGEPCHDGAAWCNQCSWSGLYYDLKIQRVGSNLRRADDVFILQRGFNLTELLITIALIGIVSAILVPMMFGGQSAATTVRCMANIDAFATEIDALDPESGNAPTQEQVRDHLNWGVKFKDYWYIPNNKDKNKGHGNDLDGCDEENPGQSLQGRECRNFKYIIVCTHETHGDNSDAKYVFKDNWGAPMIVPYGEYRRTYLLDANWWPYEDPGYDEWIGMVPTK